jgi:Carbohydrate-selective porin, OprB family
VIAVYQYEVCPGWTLQPNFQYFVSPGGGATGPNPEELLKVLGLRTVLKFKSAAAPARNAPTMAFEIGTLRLRGNWIDLALLINARWDHFGSSTRRNHRVRKL